MEMSNKEIGLCMCTIHARRVLRLFCGKLYYTRDHKLHLAPIAINYTYITKEE
jgi:hypothetical protein